MCDVWNICLQKGALLTFSPSIPVCPSDPGSPWNGKIGNCKKSSIFSLLTYTMYQIVFGVEFRFNM